MFEVAELGHKIKKQEYNKAVPELRTQLLEAQQQLTNTDFPVIILISGVDGGGKGIVINRLNEWLDTRYLDTHAYGPRSEEERERPHYWRYWMALPPKGNIGIYVGSWYSQPIAQRITDKISNGGLDMELTHINHLERELIDDGALIIKCWLHLSKKRQKKRIRKLQKNKETAWKVNKLDKKHLKLYDKFCSISERVLRETSTGEAPWMIVDGSDERYACFTVGQHILDRITTHMKDRELHAEIQQRKTSRVTTSNELSVLNALDMTQKLTKVNYESQLGNLQGKLSRLSRAAYENKLSSILMFEGWDAGGKGGAIRRLTQAMDARQYRVIPVAAPTDEEKAHHYLWRFWRQIPRDGKVTIYDRSWYGRVLVERIENFARENEWMRAYAEINDFEEELTSHGIIVLKYWLHITNEEQLTRFQAREEISYKKHKITEEDYRNRERWDDYELAVNDMVTRTSTEYAPWMLIEGNDKRFARIKILKSYVKRLEQALDNRLSE